MKEYINVPGFPESVKFTDKMHDALANTALATCAVKLNMLVDGDVDTLEAVTGEVAEIGETSGLDIDEMSVVLQYLRDLPENQPVVEAES